MRANPTAATEQKLLKLKQPFEYWRQTRKKPSERIPVSLWDQAIELTQVLANSYVAKQLRLSPGDLKRRRLSQPASAIVAMPAAAPSFIELPAPASWSWSSAEPVSIEVERTDGARMRLSYRQAPSLATMLQAFRAIVKSVSCSTTLQTGHHVVMPIDEYDKPILDALTYP